MRPTERPPVEAIALQSNWPVVPRPRPREIPSSIPYVSQEHMSGDTECRDGNDTGPGGPCRNPVFGARKGCSEDPAILHLSSQAHSRWQPETLQMNRNTLLFIYFLVSRIGQPGSNATAQRNCIYARFAPSGTRDCVRERQFAGLPHFPGVFRGLWSGQFAPASRQRPIGRGHRSEAAGRLKLRFANPTASIAGVGLKFGKV